MMKRLFDSVAAAIGLIVLLPLLLGIALAILLTSPGGAFYRQTRIGLKGRPFRLLKFRSMRPGSDADLKITVGGRDPRITPIGYFIRKSKLDELPQLINVLFGDMSLVGPRPEVPEYVALYTTEQREVLSVRPGVTSLASIAYMDENELLGRSADPTRTYVEEVMPAKLALDLQYVSDRSTFKDLRIILRTLGKVLGFGR